MKAAYPAKTSLFNTYLILRPSFSVSNKSASTNCLMWWETADCERLSMSTIQLHCIQSGSFRIASIILRRYGSPSAFDIFSTFLKSNNVFIIANVSIFCDMTNSGAPSLLFAFIMQQKINHIHSKSNTSGSVNVCG